MVTAHNVTTKKDIVKPLQYIQETSNTLTTPDIAYGNYKNSGVTKANSNGIAILKVRQPQGYKVPRL